MLSKTFFTLALPALASAAHFPKEQYDSGEVHQKILAMKNVSNHQGLDIYDEDSTLTTGCIGTMGCARGCRRTQFEPMALMEYLGST